ncbi:DUF2332 domain-containing protein [Streptacidiphilus anmyonensis]|uniref:DUF2332 domain-containing protein n=1 Tax=Streptacidiphilus anmyonensis TaxID=405782 RepID=UPI00128DF064|nr:DUF2332 domain-containing protein [Streptacidiphilus anmyonensis]
MTTKITETPRERVRRAFTEPGEFRTSPLYRALSRTVAGDEALLDLAAGGRPGQYPTFLFFGAVHHLLLTDAAAAGDPLAAYYPSLLPPGATARPAEEAGPALVDFCARHADALRALIGTRLVQTNQVQRALGLRFGLAAIAAELGDRPVHLIEVGTSAGLNLRFDRYGYRLGGRGYGDPDSPVQLVAELYGDGEVPDLDALPRLASVVGVDLNPVDVLDREDRQWLRALVWPENQDQGLLLAAALDLVAGDPPPILAGDAIDVLPGLAASLPDGEPRVVYHSATRMHVPAERLDAFDAAIASLGDSGPLWWLSVEEAPDPDPRTDPSRGGASLRLRGPDGDCRDLAVVEGHLRWVETLAAR